MTPLPDKKTMSIDIVDNGNGTFSVSGCIHQGSATFGGTFIATCYSPAEAITHARKIISQMKRQKVLG